MELIAWLLCLALVVNDGVAIAHGSEEGMDFNMHIGMYQDD